MSNLTKNFATDEMKCKCGCDICNVNLDFITKLQFARSLAGIKFIITSGCRCPKHNTTVGSTNTSDHITTEFIQCKGADILCNNSLTRYKIIEAALEAGFKRIGVSKSFIHLGNKSTNSQEVLWLY